jgi:hypothetical protein
MTQEVAKKENGAVTQYERKESEALRTDVLLPKILLMQGLSQWVIDRKAQQGDILRSTTAEIIGGPDKPVDFIPLLFTNAWRMEEHVAGKFEYRGTEPRTAKTEDSPWEFEKNGAKWRRMKVVNVFALLPSDIAAMDAELKKAKESGEMPDLNKTLLPVLLSFRSTSYNAGKAVVTHFVKAQGMAKYGAKPHGYTLSLGCYGDKNDKGSFSVYDVKQGRKCSKSEFEAAEAWLDRLSTTSYQVDESDENSEAQATGAEVC